MHRRQLPLAFACDRHDPRRDGPRCGHCDKVVHDLSAMDEASAVALLSGQRERICIAYQSRADGTVRFAPRPGAQAPGWSVAAIVMTAVLTGCTPIAESGGLQEPHANCTDPNGYRIECIDAEGYRTIPFAEVQPEQVRVVEAPAAKRGKPAEGPHNQVTTYTWDDDIDAGIFVGDFEPDWLVEE